MGRVFRFGFAYGKFNIEMESLFWEVEDRLQSMSKVTCTYRTPSFGFPACTSYCDQICVVFMKCSFLSGGIRGHQPLQSDVHECTKRDAEDRFPRAVKQGVSQLTPSPLFCEQFSILCSCSCNYEVHINIFSPLRSCLISKVKLFQNTVHLFSFQGGHTTWCYHLMSSD